VSDIGRLRGQAPIKPLPLAWRSMSMIEVDAVVIGGGIVGASAALFLGKAGKRVRIAGTGFLRFALQRGELRRRAASGSSVVAVAAVATGSCHLGELPQLIGIDGEYQRSGHLKLARSQRSCRPARLRTSAEASALTCKCSTAGNCGRDFHGSEMWRWAHRIARTTATPTREWSRPAFAFAAGRAWRASA
jgi:glycine/D-amino acid oxidase-like deaminating enzyme